MSSTQKRKGLERYLSSDLLEDKIDYKINKLSSSAERFQFIVGHESCPGFDEITKDILAGNTTLDIEGCKSSSGSRIFA